MVFYATCFTFILHSARYPWLNSEVIYATIPSIMCCIGNIELCISEYTIGETIDPGEGPTSIVSPPSPPFPPGPVELSLLASSGSRSSAWVIHSRYPRMSSSICCFSLSFWKSPLDLAFSLSLENSLQIKQCQTYFSGKTLEVLKKEINLNTDFTMCEILCELTFIL